VAAGAVRQLEWLPGARRAFHETLAQILEDDPRSAELVRARVERAMTLVQAHPHLGTPTPRRGERRFAVPSTGHVFHYRISRSAIHVVLWYRARQRIHA
jgi:plasmid stabilization system protein ParE